MLRRDLLPLENQNCAVVAQSVSHVNILQVVIFISLHREFILFSLIRLLHLGISIRGLPRPSVNPFLRSFHLFLFKGLQFAVSYHAKSPNSLTFLFILRFLVFLVSVLVLILFGLYKGVWNSLGGFLNLALLVVTLLALLWQLAGPIPAQAD